MRAGAAEPVGTCCIVLHTHLPWLAHHGSWPVGEEWLYQAWAAAYLPLVDLLERLAAEGRRDLLTLGVTPVLAAQLDDPYCLREMHTWLGFWQTRALSLASSTDAVMRAVGARESAAAQRATHTFESRWLHGATPLLRALADARVVELLGGPATHPFLPLLDERVATFALEAGLSDAAIRAGQRPEGIWAPECAYRPGLERIYAAAGVRHSVLDGPTLQHVGAHTAAAWTLGSTDVVAFGRDLDVTYRVWSPRRGYPGGSWYRDFHTYDHASGLRPARVTSSRTPPQDKAPYDPERAAAAVRADVADFVSVVRRRLDVARERLRRPGVVVVAYDTELFGHWWHEGPAFLEQVLRALPAAGVRPTTLRGAVEAGHVAGPVHPGEGSWGAGKDFHVWDGPAVADFVAGGRRVQKRLLDVVDAALSATGEALVRHADLDQLARDALLALASDWPFMVSHGSAQQYALERGAGHEQAFDALAHAIERGRGCELAERQRAIDGPFGTLDARLLSDG